MEVNTVLASLPEIGIGLVGFTGVVAVFGRRAAGQWNPSDLTRFYLLLHMSTLVVFLSLVPAWLGQLKISAAAIWQLSSGLLALGHGSSFAWALSSVRPTEASPGLVRLRPFVVPIFAIGAFVILGEVVVAFGFFRALGEFIFTGALMWVLLLAVLSFVTLLFPDPE
jgi:hypothetical protein